MLVPANAHSSPQGNFQTSALVLPAASAAGQVTPQCAIDGRIFSLSSASPLDSRHWTVRSPSVSGWNTLAGEFDMDSQWKIFTRGLVRMNENGCFPPGLTALQIRTAIAQRIPLPAQDVPLFFYSEQGIGFIDLAPGMEVRLQRFLPAAESSGSPSFWNARYDVVPRPGEGVRLKLARVQKDSIRASGPEEKQLLSLSRRFAQTPVLRLFLEGVYARRKVSQGILIGASNLRQLDALTDLIHQTDPARCRAYQETVCTEFPLGGVSLFYTVWVNGHRTSCLFGNSLASLFTSLPPPQQTAALQSVQVLRQRNPDRYAGISFPRTEDGAEEVLLLPGDRIEWKH